MIEIRGLSFRYAGESRDALHNIDMTVIVVEQKIMLLSAYAKKLAVLNDGQLELFGPVREVLRHSARLEAIGVHCPRVVTLSNRLADLTGGALATDLDEAEILVREVLA